MSQPEPLVCAVMLTKDRSEMAARAVRAFRAQTYQNKRLYVLDSGEIPSIDALPDHYPEHGILFHRTVPDKRTIGELRNWANHFAVGDGAEILIHFDDDDVSHPNRIAEQVAFLQSARRVRRSGADVVGYSELLFWRKVPEWAPETNNHGEAWIWKNNIGSAGSSFCYWRKTWERKPFPDLPHPDRGGGEDFTWAQGLNVAMVSSLAPEPRLICSIHGGNVTPYSAIIEKSNNWKRAPEWDDYARERMKL